MDISELVKEGKTTREIAECLGFSQRTVCRRLKDLGLKTKAASRVHDCSKCGESDPNNFYGDDKSYCKACHSKYYVEQARKLKVKAREFLGGKCLSCGWNKYPCSLDCHHLNPEEKDPNFASMSGWSWERAEKELKKCVLLCKNCHTAVHSGLLELS